MLQVRLLVYLVLLLGSGVCFGQTRFKHEQEIELCVNTTRLVTTVSDRFVSFTLDWWPPDQGCFPSGWGRHANAATVNLNHPKLKMLAKALGPSILRIGGSLDKLVIYNIPGGMSCNASTSVPCLTAERWEALHDFARDTNAQIVFGLSYPQSNAQSRPGAWNYLQAQALMQYSWMKNYSQRSTFHGVELAEEFSRGFPVDSRSFARYIRAYHECARLLRSIWKDDPLTKPKLMGPCPGMNWPTLATWFPVFLRETKDVLDVTVYHSYNQIQVADNDTQANILYLNDTIPSGNLSTQKGASPGGTGWQAHAMRQFVDNLQPRDNPHHGSKKLPELWLGEFGPHNGGGGYGTFSSTFASSFGYLDTLGSLARLDHKVLARQTLVGGNYELLRCTSGYLPGGNGCDFEPHPDYWVALLWKRLMGSSVLPAPKILVPSPGGEENSLRFHAHCTAAPATEGSITIAFSNMSTNTTFVIRNTLLSVLGGTRMEYILRAHLTQDGNSHPLPRKTTMIHQSDFNTRILELNGVVLTVGNNMEPPPLPGNTVSNNDPWEIHPVSLGYIVFPQAQSAACVDDGRIKTVLSQYR